MVDWIKTPKDINQTRIFEVPGSSDDSSITDIYIQRYLNSNIANQEDKIKRYIEEVISDIEDGASLLIVGSGHPELTKLFRTLCPRLGKIGCVDRIKEAGCGLGSYSISFYQLDIMLHSLPLEYEYIFSSHTLEHFTRNELIGKVLPRMNEAAVKAVYAVVPFEEAWADEPTHRCRFHIGDELFCSSSKYKLIHETKELVLKFQ